MKPNRLRQKLDAGETTVSTNIYTSSPDVVEMLGHAGTFDYVEFEAEYVPYDLHWMDHFARRHRVVSPSVRHDQDRPGTQDLHGGPGHRSGHSERPLRGCSHPGGSPAMRRRHETRDPGISGASGLWRPAGVPVLPGRSGRLREYSGELGRSSHDREEIGGGQPGGDSGRGRHRHGPVRGRRFFPQHRQAGPVGRPRDHRGPEPGDPNLPEDGGATRRWESIPPGTPAPTWTWECAISSSAATWGSSTPSGKTKASSSRTSSPDTDGPRAHPKSPRAPAENFGLGNLNSFRRRKGRQGQNLIASGGRFSCR